MNLVETFLSMTNNLENLNSFEFVYGIDSPFICVDGHIGISNQIHIEFLMQAKQLCDTGDSNFLLYSFVFCCLNPRDYTIYNRRKDIICNNTELLGCELKRIDLLQKQYPKVPELWDHRRYVLKCLIRKQQLTPQLLQSEMEHCYTMCDRYPRNYYSWTTLQLLLPLYSLADIRHEIQRNREFFSTHIKDYSALFRRQTLLKELRKTGEYKEQIQEDIAIVKQQSNLYGENESTRIHLECLEMLLNDP